MTRRPKDDLPAKLQHAQMTLVEQALIGWLEEREGKVVSDEEALRHGRWVVFAPTPLSIFRKDGWSWSKFYVWRNEFAVAIDFLDPEDLLCLKFVEMPADEWPTALKLWASQQKGKT